MDVRIGLVLKATCTLAEKKKTPLYILWDMFNKSLTNSTQQSYT